MSESKQINTRIQNKYDLEVNWNALEAILATEGKTFVPLEGEVIIYGTEVDENDNILVDSDGNPLLPTDRTKPYTYPRMKIGDGETSLKDLDFVTGQSEKIAIDPPAFLNDKNTLLYNRELQCVYQDTSGSIELSYDANTMRIEDIIGNGYAKDVGTYTLTIVPREGYYFKGDNADRVSLTWSIVKDIDEDIQISSTKLVLTNYSRTASCIIEGKDVGLQSTKLSTWWGSWPGATSGKFHSLNVDYKIDVINEQKIKYSCTLIDIPEEETYVSGSLTIRRDMYEDVTSNFRIEYEIKTFNDLSWEEIATIASEGNASNYFDIGDTKIINLAENATPENVLKLAGWHTYTSPYEVKVYILDFDHYRNSFDDSTPHSIEFGFKHINGTDICFIGDYAKYDTSFYTDKTGFTYFDSERNEDDLILWETSHIRKDILGSHLNPRQISITEGETAYPLIYLLPEELRNCMLPMTVYNRNWIYRNNSWKLSYTATEEYLPIPDKDEICDNDSYSSGITYKFKYYEANPSTPRYALDETNTIQKPIKWWTRTQYREANHMYVISDTMKAIDEEWRRCFGIAPVFSVGSTTV